jgi:hypothetical protein
VAVRIRHAIDIAAPQAAVWDAFLRLSDWPRWFPALTALERSTGDPFSVGESFVLCLSFRGHGAKIPVRVMEHDPPCRVRWVGRNLGVTGDHAFFAEVIDANHTRFVSEEAFTGFPVRLIPKRIFGELEAETQRGMQTFAELVIGRR